MKEILKIKDLNVWANYQLIIKDLSNELVSMQFTLFRDLLNGQRVINNGKTNRT